MGMLRTAALLWVSLIAALPAVGQTRLYTVDGRYLIVRNAVTLQPLAQLDFLQTGNLQGIALANNNSRAYVGLGGGISGRLSNDPPAAGQLRRVAVVDLFTLSVVQTLDVGGFPTDAFVSSPAGDRVYFATSSSQTITIIRTSDNTLESIAMPAFVSALAISPDGRKLYVNSGGILEVDTTNFAVQQFASTNVNGCGLAVSPDGSRLYATGQCSVTGTGTVSAYDIATRSVVGQYSGQPVGHLALTPDGSKLVVGSGSAGNGALSPTVILDTATMTKLGETTPSGLYTAMDPSGARAYTFGYYGTVSPNRASPRLTSVNTSTYTLEQNLFVGAFAPGGLVAAPVSPCGNFVVSPSYSAVTTAGGSGSFSAPVPAGCAWSIASTDSWLTITSATSGVGPATITYTVGPSTGPRTAELRINGQVLPVYQTQPLVNIDAPAPGSHVLQGFNLAGWVGELAVAGPASAVLSNPLAIHVWAYPAGGGQPQLVAQTTASSFRPDVAAVFPGYQTGGFNVTVTGLAPGTYTFVVYLFSPYVNSFAAAQTVTLAVDPSVFSVIDTIAPNASVTVPFRLGGWALDASAPTGTGVDVVNVYAYPDAGGAPIFSGTAAYGLTRNDLVQSFGARFRDTGFGLAVDGLAPGGYTLVAYAHSTVTGVFVPGVVHVTVTGAAEPLEIETFGIPPGGNPHAIFATGWAIDRRAASGVGVTAVQAWAYPTNGGNPIFVGSAQMPFSRPDIGAIYGARYRDSGWTLGGTLPSGSYQVAFFALSAATGTFDNVRVRPLIVP